jgi:hypothetical protein
MEQSPSWEADSRSASKEILHLLWNSDVHYHVHKRRIFFLFLHVTKGILLFVSEKRTK